jgi:hypothetical protein
MLSTKLDIFTNRFIGKNPHSQKEWGFFCALIYAFHLTTFSDGQHRFFNEVFGGIKFLFFDTSEKGISHITTSSERVVGLYFFS